MENATAGFDLSLVTDAGDVIACHTVMRQLRPHLDRAAFVEAVESQRSEGYRLLVARAGGRPVGVAGFIVRRNLAWGRHVYVDDLVTDEAYRGRGVGDSLLAWVVDFARSERCRAVHLDSGVQRHGAHRFYLTHGFHISSHHFSRDLD